MAWVIVMQWNDVILFKNTKLLLLLLKQRNDRYMDRHAHAETIRLTQTDRQTDRHTHTHTHTCRDNQADLDRQTSRQADLVLHIIGFLTHSTFLWTFSCCAVRRVLLWMTSVSLSAVPSVCCASCHVSSRIWAPEQFAAKPAKLIPLWWWKKIKVSLQMVECYNTLVYEFLYLWCLLLTRCRFRLGSITLRCLADEIATQTLLVYMSCHSLIVLLILIKVC